MGNALQDKTVVVVGRGSGIARAVVLLAHDEGARVIVAGRDKAKLADAYDGLDIAAETVDVTDDISIGALADRVGPVDHVVSTASARARGKLADLDRKNLQLSFDTKVIGPTMLAKHFAQQMNPGGSFVLFSGVNAFKVNVGYLGVATPGAVDFSPARWRQTRTDPGQLSPSHLWVVGEDGKRSHFSTSVQQPRRARTRTDVAAVCSRCEQPMVCVKDRRCEPLTGKAHGRQAGIRKRRHAGMCRGTADDYRIWGQVRGRDGA
jgi:NAD(P)-dependent dehydrogenase (short-subunit alcohol dehydrogenase family)